MNFAVCPISVAAIRSAPSHKAEMLSQLLFGECVEITETRGKAWCKVLCHWDDTMGWVAVNQLLAITPTEFEQYQKEYAYCLEILQPVVGNNQFLPITLGARLPLYDGIRFSLAGQAFQFSGQAFVQGNAWPNLESLLKISKRFLHAPYLKGGRTPLGIDSDGLLQLVFQLANVAVPRWAEEQIYVGHAVDFQEQARTGDVAFLQDRGGKTVHVGLILSPDSILHAFGRVRIDRIDHFGVYCEELQAYTHTLRIIKRWLPDSWLQADTRKDSATSASVNMPQQIDLF